MKAQILKIAGVKSEKEFYKKYPSEEAFMKVHGKEFKKAQTGVAIDKAQFGGYYNLGQTPNFQTPDAAAGFMPRDSFSMQTPKLNIFDPQGDQSQTKMAQRIFEGAHSVEDSPFSSSKMSGAQQILGSATGIIDAAGAFKEQKKKLQGLKQQRGVADVSLQAAQSTDVDARRQMQDTFSKQRNAMMQPMTGENLFPVNGVGTNVLARNGRMLQEGGVAGDANDYEPVDVSSFTGNPDWSINNDRDIEQITEYTDPNEMTDAQASSFMENYNRDQGKSTPTFDSNSARDTWVNKTGLPWSEAKKLGYTSGSAKDNSKLLAELNDPRFRKENLRTEAPKNSTQTRTPVQHRETPTGKLAPIKTPIKSYAEAMKGKPKYQGNNTMLSADKRDSYQREIDSKRSQAEYDDDLTLERGLYYMANPSKAFGDLKSVVNPMFTSDDETSEGFRKEVMANRYNPNQTNKQRLVNHIKKGLKLTPKAAANLATALSATPYTTFEPLAVGIGEGAAPRVAGYLGQGARQIGQGAAKQLSGKAAKQLGQGYVPNFIMRKNGGPVGGNPTEIQNTYSDEYDIYTDSGYEPLNDSEIVKQYYNGGGIPQAQNGFSNFMGAGGTDFANKAVMGAFGNNAGSQMGTAVGGALKMIPGVGPVLGAVAAPVLGAIGGGLDQAFGDAGKIKKEQAGLDRSMMGLQNVSATKDLQRQNQSYMEDGGWVSNDWQPQVITSFGGLDEQEVYDYAHEGMDTLRAGGHLREYTPPSNRAMETYKNGGDVQSYGLGGELQTHWGGGAETISRNPYLPGTGETVMFRGKSHEEYSPNGETGIGVTYGGNPVEVERGEPMVELEEGGVVDPMTGEVQKSGVVFGNLKIPNQYIDMLGDKNAKGKKFKNYVNDLSKIESKQNTLIEKSTKELDGLTPRNSFDKLKLTALQASIQGANMKLKDIADKKINAASLQNAINDTAEENGLVADSLAKGKVQIDKEAIKQQAKYGAFISKAQGGDKIKKFDSPEEATAAGYKLESDGKYHLRTKGVTPKPTVSKLAVANKDIPRQSRSPEGLYGGITPAQFEEYKKKNDWYDWSGFNLNRPGDVLAYENAFNAKAKEYGSDAYLKPDDAFGQQVYSANISMNKNDPASLDTDQLAEINTVVEEEPVKDKFNWMNIVNAAVPYLRPTDQESLDMEQLYPEMYAMATNQLEPVQANFYRPELGVPYDISLQDQLNANQADYRAAQRMMGYNPAAQANLNAQKYAANSQVLGEQFRANQAMKDRVYGENRNILNDAKLKNLGIADQQYTRQAEAMSNTKATTQAALNSIADKYAKNKLENRTLGVYENMYNYRYDSKGRAINMNPFAQFNTEMGGKSGSSKGKGLAEGKGFTYDENGNIVGVRSIGKEENSRNGSIVKSYKNL